MKDACPGIGYFTNLNKTERAFVETNSSACHYKTLPYVATQGVVYGICEDSVIYCHLHVKEAKGLYISARVLRQEYWCSSEHWKVRIFLGMYSQTDVICSYHTLDDMAYLSNKNLLWIVYLSNPLVTVGIQTITSRTTIITDYITSHSGYVFTPYLPDIVRFSKILQVNNGCGIMLSVYQTYYLDACGRIDAIRVLFRQRGSLKEHREYVCAQPVSPTRVFPIPNIAIEVMHDSRKVNFVRLRFCAFCEKTIPYVSPRGLFNCSVNHYLTFQQFLHCNLKTECEDGRDEAEHCPFSGPGCQGMVASRDKCLKFISFHDGLGLRLWGFQCERVGQRLGSLKSRQEQNDALHKLKNYHKFNFIIAFSSGWTFLSFTYSKFRYWFDRTIIYNLNHFSHNEYSQTSITRTPGYGYWAVTGFTESVREPLKSSALCETPVQGPARSLQHVVLTHSQSDVSVFTNTQQNLLICIDSPVSHSFIHWDPYSQCLQRNSSLFLKFQNEGNKLNETLSLKQSMEFIDAAMFSCNDGFQQIHHTFVCDFRQDCPDSFDESFCEHPPCYGFQCQNGQCISQSQRCNEFADCVDDSDEIGCEHDSSKSCAYCTEATGMMKHLHFYINLDGTGYFTHQLINREDVCPDSHYSCIEEWLYCLPVYTKCNEYSDCVYGEDEQGCDGVQCSGLYQCRSSSVCVHGDHLCDGWGQCPQRDDELMCDMTCPEGCLCHGHSLFCRNRFFAHQFSHVRFVDASGSGMSLDEFTENIYLLSLTLSSSSISNISSIGLPNLQFIDLSRNLLQSMNMNVFLQLPNLRDLRLARNPIKSKTVNKLSKQIHYLLTMLDISNSDLDILEKELSVYMPNIKSLNISLSKVNVIGSVGFKNMPRLGEIDTRLNPLEEFPLDIFSKSDQLQVIFSSNHRFCCKNVLAAQSTEINCFTPHTILSSCTTLMPSEIFRIFFWVIGVCATLGNMFCFTSVLVAKGSFQSNSKMIANLMFAKSFAGCHVSIVAIANEIYDVHFLQFENMWTRSLACKVAGFLLYLSSEASLSVLLFITMDHLIVICYNRNLLTLRKISLSLVYTAVWCFASFLSIIPFLPVLNVRGLQGQSGLCRLALFNIYSFNQKMEYFSVIVVINVIICFVIAAGQTVLYKRTPNFRIALDSTTRAIYSSVHLIRTMAFVDNASWFSLGFVKLIVAIVGIPFYPIYEAMIVFVLPLSSAFAPFLYLLVLALQKRQQTLEAKVVNVLRSRLTSSGKQAFKK